MTEEVLRREVLREGNKYDFEIKKLIRLSDEQSYFILIDPYGKKHLMFDRYYIHYGMKTGDVICCNIDKINCNGRIYLEPQHPYYQNGRNYEIEFLDVMEIENSKKKKLFILHVNDSYHSTAFLQNVRQSHYKDFISRKVIAKVEYVKKARLYLKIV